MTDDRSKYLRRTAAKSDALVYVRNCLLGLEAMSTRIFTTRQLTLFLVVHQDCGPHTVRGLAAQTGIPKVDVTRSLDRLEEAGLVRRTRDPTDRRSVILVPTMLGGQFCVALRNLAQTGRAKIAVELSASIPSGTKRRQPGSPASAVGTQPHLRDRKREDC